MNTVIIYMGHLQCNCCNLLEAIMWYKVTLHISTFVNHLFLKGSIHKLHAYYEVNPTKKSLIYFNQNRRIKMLTSLPRHYAECWVWTLRTILYYIKFKTLLFADSSRTFGLKMYIHILWGVTFKYTVSIMRIDLTKLLEILILIQWGVTNCNQN